ncbi:hypothetical protein F5Y19DRAFT_473080 [Xylariaceae sp. FL1651]|nr:hypothetical protein F5Y19DRAFT_473080 [Xylariaceae sp. FL1651]
MISFKQIPLLVAGLGAFALPIYADTLFQYCVDPNFVNCHDICGVAGQCIPVPTGLSSARAASGYNCYIFNENTNCAGNRGGPVTNDDRHYNLTIFGWNDITMSIQCAVA